jgi:hypothetical protein
MSYTIYKSTSALIAQPGRAVNTFPSGLVRVDQIYLGLTANAATHRATLAVGNNMPDGDSSPCIDGLKIFPEVQERRREDGWTEYLVSAYGRLNATGSFDKKKKRGLVKSRAVVTYQSNLFDGDENLTSSGFAYVVNPDEQNAINILGDVLTFKVVLPLNQIPSFVSPGNLIRRYNLENGQDITNKGYVLSDLYNSTRKDDALAGPAGNTLVPAYYTAVGGASFVPITITWSEGLISIESINYGSFDEYTLVWEDAGGLIAFGNFNQNQIPDPAHIEVNGISATSFQLIVGQPPHAPTNKITKLELWVYVNNVVVNGYNGKVYTSFSPSVRIQEAFNAVEGDALKIRVKLTNPFGERSREIQTLHHFS